eukprot:ANDGO_03985.mRNA.1 hypothetical protein isoform 1
MDRMEDGHSIDPNLPTIQVCMTSGSRIPIRISLASSIRDLKHRLVVEHQLSGFIRILFNGRVLEDALSLQRCGLSDGCAVHCIVSAAAPPTPHPSAGSVSGGRSSQHQSQLLTNNNNNNNNNNSGGGGGDGQSTQNGDPRGFDRFLASGLSAEEVAVLRRQFHSSNNTPIAALQPGNEAILRRIEDAWIDEDVDRNTVNFDMGQFVENAPVEGSNHDLMWGMIIGFFLGLLTLLLFWEKRASRRIKVGVIAGLCFNVSFSLVRTLMTP